MSFAPPTTQRPSGCTIGRRQNPCPPPWPGYRRTLFAAVRFPIVVIRAGSPPSPSPLQERRPLTPTRTSIPRSVASWALGQNYQQQISPAGLPVEGFPPVHDLSLHRQTDLRFSFVRHARLKASIHSPPPANPAVVRNCLDHSMQQRLGLTPWTLPGPRPASGCHRTGRNPREPTALSVVCRFRGVTRAEDRRPLLATEAHGESTIASIPAAQSRRAAPPLLPCRLPTTLHSSRRPTLSFSRAIIVRVRSLLIFHIDPFRCLDGLC